MKKILLLLTLISPLTLFSFNALERETLRKEIKNRLETVLRVYESAAKVDLSVKFRGQQRILNKRNPLLLGKPSQQNQSARSLIRQIQVTVYSQFSEKEFPEEAAKKLKDILAQYSRSYSFNYEMLPTKQGGFFSKMSSFELLLLGFLMITSLVAFGFMIFKKSVSSEKGSSKINETLLQLKDSVEQVALAFPQYQPNHPLEPSQPISLEVQSGGETFLRDFTLESLEEVLMDCYWAKEDEYAAYLWSKLDINRKASLINRNGRINEYANYLSNLTGIDKKYIN